MKILYSLAILLLSVFGIANAQWTNVDFSTNMDVQLDICFLDANTGFTIGYTLDSASTSNMIYRTTNGGTTWTKVLDIIDWDTSLTSHSMHSIFFTSPSNGFVAGGRDAAHPFICKTIDGGVTWSTISLVQYTKTIMNIFFPSSNVGYMCGDVLAAQTGLFKTTDGGSTWSDISGAASTATGGTPIYDVYFLDANNGFACTQPISNAQAGIYKTTNGGASWTQVYTVANNEGFSKLQFINSSTGFAASSLGKVYKTLDGGTTWTSIAIASTQLNINDVYFFSPLLGYAAGGDINNFSGAIYKTTDGGVSWTLDNNGNYVIGTTYYSLSFAGGKGYACGIGGYSKNNNVAGINESNADLLNITISPNPTTGIFTVTLSGVEGQSSQKISSVEIVTLLGKKVYSSSPLIMTNKSEIDLSSQRNGIYFLHLKTPLGIISQKIIVQK